MSTISLRLPHSLHETARELAQKDSVFINQFVTLALAEKISAMLTVKELDERAARGSKKKFMRVMAKVADREPQEQDRL